MEEVVCFTRHLHPKDAKSVLKVGTVLETAIHLNFGASTKEEVGSAKPA